MFLYLFNTNDYQKMNDRYGMDYKNGEDMFASTWKMKKGADKSLFIVYNTDHRVKLRSHVFAHEAVHAADILFDHIREDNPGFEQKAYWVDYIYRLSKDFIKKTNKKK